MKLLEVRKRTIQKDYMEHVKTGVIPVSPGKFQNSQGSMESSGRKINAGLAAAFISPNKG